MLKKMMLLISVMCIAACNMVRDGAMIRAYNAYDQGDCILVYRRLVSAEKYLVNNDKRRAEISFLRASCYEKERKYTDARSIYQYIVTEFPRTEYAYRSKERLKTRKKLKGTSK